MTILGVLAWLPFILLVALGYEPSIFPFLAVHLTGVIGGSRLRSSANPESKKKHSRRTVIGRILIILGVLFVAMGLLAEIIVRTYYESQGKRVYRVRNYISSSQVQDGALPAPSNAEAA